MKHFIAWLNANAILIAHHPLTVQYPLYMYGWVGTVQMNKAHKISLNFDFNGGGWEIRGPFARENGY